jgi:hypothetical protein
MQATFMNSWKVCEAEIARALGERIYREVKGYLPKYSRKLRGGQQVRVRGKTVYCSQLEWNLLSLNGTLTRSGKSIRLIVREPCNTIVQYLLSIVKEDQKNGTVQRVTSLSFRFNPHKESLYISIEGTFTNAVSGNDIVLLAPGKKAPRSACRALARAPVGSSVVVPTILSEQ